MKTIQIILLITGVIVVMILAYFTFNSLTNPTKIDQDKMEDNIQVAPPAEVIDEKTGEVNMESFQEVQAVSGDDSLNTIEAELNKTIILEEDFSDL